MIRFVKSLFKTWSKYLSINKRPAAACYLTAAPGCACTDHKESVLELALSFSLIGHRFYLSSSTLVSRLPCYIRKNLPKTKPKYKGKLSLINPTLFIAKWNLMSTKGFVKTMRKMSSNASVQAKI